MKTDMTENIYWMICEKKLLCGTEGLGVDGIGNHGPDTGGIMDRTQGEFCKNMLRIPASAANGTAESGLGR